MSYKLERISTESIHNCKYLRHLFNAIAEINLNSVAFFSDGEGEWAKIYERNFIIYLASQLGYQIKQFNSEDCINGEVYKKIHALSEESYKKTYKHCKRVDLPTEFYTVPDFIIHQNHDELDLDQKKQHLALEAKSETSITQKQFDWDFFKLNNYLDILNYSNAVYLLIGPQQMDIENLLNNYISNEYYLSERHKANIYFVIKGVPQKDEFSSEYTNNPEDGVYKLVND